MAVRFAAKGVDKRVWFRIQRGGTLVAGVSPSNITVTLVAPDDSDSTAIVPVAGTEKAGSYYYDVPAAFTALHGAGEYIVVVEVSSLLPFVRATFQDFINVTEESLDSLSLKVSEIYQLLGLDPDNPVCISKTQQVSGTNITINHTEVGDKVCAERES